MAIVILEGVKTGCAMAVSLLAEAISQPLPLLTADAIWPNYLGGRLD
ncbi:MAG: hypothetical protein AAF722_07230 [Cyanobacteria bacterium P01_C01_bin.70]